MKTKEDLYAQHLRETLQHIDHVVEQLPEAQVLGILVTEAAKGNMTAKQLLLCQQRALLQIDEAERLAFYGRPNVQSYE
jgi:hypothetical protein